MRFVVPMLVATTCLRIALSQTTTIADLSRTPAVGPISGQLIGYSGEPVRNQEIRLTIQDREPFPGRTDVNGRFSFGRVEHGRRIFLQVSARGFNRSPIDLGPASFGDLGTLVLQPGNFPMRLALKSGMTGRLPDFAGKILGFRRSRQASYLQLGARGEFVFPAAPHLAYELSVHGNGVLGALDETSLRIVGQAVISGSARVNFGNIRVVSDLTQLAGPFSVVPPGSAQAVAAVVSVAGGMTVIHRDGTSIQAPKENEQVGCSHPKISPDGVAGGWLVNAGNCCTSYPLSRMLVVYRPGLPIRRFRGDDRAIFGWEFINGSKQVVTYQDYPHGNAVRHFELRDVATGRLVAQWDDRHDDEPRRVPPAWTRTLAH